MISFREVVIACILFADSTVVVLRTRHWQKFIDEIKSEERSKKHESSPVETFVFCKEVIHERCHHDIIIGIVTQAKGFRPESARHALAEFNGGLKTKYVEVDAGEEMVQVVELLTKLVCFWIPLNKCQHEDGVAQEYDEARRPVVVEQQQKSHHSCHYHASHHHLNWVVDSFPPVECHDERDAHIEEREPLHAEESFSLLFLEKDTFYLI